MLCTHIIYGNARLDEDTYSIYSRYSGIDTEEDGGRGASQLSVLILFYL
jgi:hypothetical protein